MPTPSYLPEVAGGTGVLGLLGVLWKVAKGVRAEAREVAVEAAREVAREEIASHNEDESAHLLVDGDRRRIAGEQIATIAVTVARIEGRLDQALRDHESRLTEQERFCRSKHSGTTA